MIHVNGAGFCDDQMPILSTIGRGPRGPKGDISTPIFADPIEWSVDNRYQPFTIVLHNGNSYMSKKLVPIGVSIDNEEYWEPIGNYNAQIEQYAAIVNSLKKDIYTDMVAVWIGDSFTEANYSGITKRFSTMVSEKYGLVEKNYAKGSTGFTHGSSTYPTMNFYGQLQAAIADNSFSNNDVKYVFVCGGRNDASDTNAGSSVDANALQTQITNILTTACSSFPNAYVVLIPLLYECVVPSSKQMRIYEYTMWDAHYTIASYQLKNVIIVPKAYMWLQGRYGFIRNEDKIHPNQKGHNLIGACIINSLSGQSFSPSIDYSLPISVGVDLSDKNFIRLFVDDSGTIWLHMNLKFSSLPAFGDYISVYEPTLTYGGNETFIVMRGNKFFNDSNTNRYQIECENNFSLQNPLLSIKIQCLNTHTNERSSCLTPIGFVGIDNSHSGVL